MSGWIKLHRQFLDWEWYGDINASRLFLHLLLRANHEDKKWCGQMVKRGQILTGRKALSEETGLSEKMIRTALNKLIKTNEVAIKSTTKNSMITIIKWEKYQQSGQQSGQEGANEGPTKGQQRATNKNVKNNKNIKNNNILEKPDDEKSEKARRLKTDWKLSEKDRDYARDRNWSETEIDNESENFVEHYTNGNGRKQTSPNWSLRWQRWVRTNFSGCGNDATAKRRKGLAAAHAELEIQRGQPAASHKRTTGMFAHVLASDPKTSGQQDSGGDVGTNLRALRGAG